MTAASTSAPLWAHVQLLGVIAQTASFTLAAQQLKLSKAAVSQRLAELERAVGVPLVQRTTRSVRLPDAGQRLVDDTAGSFAQIELSLASVRELAAEPRGLVRMSPPGRPKGECRSAQHEGTPVSAPVALGRQHIAPCLEAFLHECLLYLRPVPPVWKFEQRPARGAAEPERASVKVQGPLRVNNSEVLRDALLAGLGLGLLPDFSAAAALRSGRLHELMPQWRPVGFFGDAIYAIRPWSPQVPRAVRSLVDHLRAALAAGFSPGAA